jgi:alpha-1,3/alpha-1,6-mannosyltransferase
MSHAAPASRLRIAFLHPELGLGGAERLVVDAALCLQEAGHQVTIFTTQHDPERCFEETRDGTLDVRVYGNRLPRHVGRRLRAPCAITRMAYLAAMVRLAREPFTVIFCDLVAHVIPVLKALSRAKVLFYCHFPDQLLVPQRHWLYRCYRVLLDRLEAIGTSMADQVLVNSHFTAAVFRRTFPHLHARPLEVLFPGVDVARYAGCIPDGSATDGNIIILSINRYEGKKNLSLAIEALVLLKDRLPPEVFAPLRLVIAGGYDERLQEHRQTFAGLQALVQRLRLEKHVRFVRSCTETERLALLWRCQCVVYTPDQEHFGLVPLEAMAAGRPVVAVDSGGPRETVQHEHTGLLCPPTPQAFAEALARLVTDPVAAARMGQAGRRHVTQHFSRTAFGARLERLVWDLVTPAMRHR